MAYRSRMGARKIDSPYENLIRVGMDPASFGYNRTRCEIIAGSARKHDDLEAVGFLGKQCAEPVHPRIVALNKLVARTTVVPRYSAAIVGTAVCERAAHGCPRKCASLTSPHRLPRRFCAELRGEPDVSYRRCVSASNRPAMAGASAWPRLLALRRVGLLHLFKQQHHAS